MGKFSMMILFVVVLNVLFFLGGVWDFGDSETRSASTLSGLFLITGSNMSGTQIRDLSLQFKNETEAVPKTGASLTSVFSGFTDPVSSLKSIYNFLIATITAPLQIMFNEDLDIPFVLRWILGPFLSVMYLFAGIDWFTRRD